MLETAVLNGTKEFRLQQEVVKARRVNADVAALSSGRTGRDQVAFLRLAVGSHRRTRSDCIVGLNLLVGVVDKVLFVRHIERTRAQRDQRVVVLLLRLQWQHGGGRSRRVSSGQQSREKAVEGTFGDELNQLVACRAADKRSRG